MDLLVTSFRDEWNGLIRLLPRLLVAAGVFVVIAWGGRAATRPLLRLLGRSQLRAIHLGFIRNVMRWIFALLGLVVALNVLGLRGVAGSLLAGGGVTAIVVGFAFRAVVENFLAGLFLVMGRSFKVGDLIASGDFEGVVRGIELRHTHIRTVDGRDVFIPSIELFTKPLVNYTLDGLRRLSFRVGIDYRDDVERARQLLLDAVMRSGFVLTDPVPLVTIGELATNAVVLQVSYWIDTFDPAPPGISVPSELMDRCRRVILENGFTISSEVSTAIVFGEGAPVGVRLEREDAPRSG